MFEHVCLLKLQFITPFYTSILVFANEIVNECIFLLWNEQNFVFGFENISFMYKTCVYQIDWLFYSVINFYVYVSCGVTDIELHSWWEYCEFESCCYLKMTKSLEHLSNGTKLK